MTMVEYMCNYTAKLQLDTSLIFSALCASIKALQENPPLDSEGQIDYIEQSRKFMVKATNSLVGKRELSSQQVASALLGNSNHYISDKYKEYFWSSMLRDLALSVFVAETQPATTDHSESNTDVDTNSNTEDELDKHGELELVGTEELNQLAI
jgi:hypothetical protein